MTHQELLNNYYEEACANIWERSTRITEDLRELDAEVLAYAGENGLKLPPNFPRKTEPIQ